MYYYLLISFILLFFGICGLFVIPKNIILLLISLELILLAINYNFIIFSIVLDDIFGQIYSIFILVVAATESSIGLAILLIYYRITNTILVEYINNLKG